MRPSTTVPRTTPGVESPAANACSPRSSSSRPSAMTTARRSSAARPVANESAMSSSSASPASGSNRSAWARRAASCFAERTTGSTDGDTVASAAVSRADSGACSRMVCALVPLMPNAETPARRGAPVSGHGRVSVISSTAPADQSTCGVGSSTCSVFGSTPCCMASTILITPATPAAACVCPMLDFTPPSHSGESVSRSLP